MGDSWTKKRYSEESKRLENSLENLDPEHCSAILRARLAQKSLTSSSEERLRAFVSLVAYLKHAPAMDAYCRQLFNVGKALLRAEGITPGRSRLSYLWGELESCRAVLQAREGSLWLGWWERQFAGHYDGRYKKLRRSSHMGDLAWLAYCNGATDIAEAYAREAIELGQHDLEFKASLPLTHIRCLDLLGRFDDAETVQERYTVQGQYGTSGTQEHWEWLSARRTYLRSHEIEGILEFGNTLKNKDPFEGQVSLEVALWLFCLRPRQSGKSLMGRRHGGMTGDAERLIDGVINALERGHRITVPLEFRCRRLGKALALIDHRVWPDIRLVIWAAAGLWLRRFHVRSQLPLVMSEYKSLSLQVTRGLHGDVFNLSHLLNTGRMVAA